MPNAAVLLGGTGLTPNGAGGRETAEPWSLGVVVVDSVEPWSLGTLAASADSVEPWNLGVNVTVDSVEPWNLGTNIALDWVEPWDLGTRPALGTGVGSPLLGWRDR